MSHANGGRVSRNAVSRVAGRSEAIGEKFPKHIYHSIVCVGALIAHREPDHWAVDAVGAIKIFMQVLL